MSVDTKRIRKTRTWIIKDWAGNVCFWDREFPSFEDAWGFIYEVESDEEAYQEYEVELK